MSERELWLLLFASWGLVGLGLYVALGLDPWGRLARKWRRRA